jgi:hypothetical protein
MACALNNEQILDLYQDIYKDILDRIENPESTVFDIKSYINTLYADILNPEDNTKALQYIQAVPEILQTVANRKDVKTYFVQNKLSLDPIMAMALDFEDLNKVTSYLQTKVLTLADVKRTLKSSIKKSKELKLSQPTEVVTDYAMSTAQGGARVTTILATTIQIANPLDPDKVSEEERNVIDSEKELFGNVIKLIAHIAEQRENPTDPIIHQGKSLMLKPMSVYTIPEEYLAKVDLDFIKIQGPGEGIFSFISDDTGNILFFDEEGNIVSSEEGKPVYTAFRKVTKENNKLLISNRSNRYYSIVSPKEQTDKIKKDKFSQKVAFSELEYTNTLNAIDRKQQKDTNDLFNLRNFIIENPDANVLIPITGGSTGYVNRTFVNLSDTEFTENDIKDYSTMTSGDKRGYSYFILEREVAGIRINDPVYLQRGDITKEIADKIADVLTTTAKLKGEELDIYSKKAFAEVFLSNSVNKNRFTVDIETKEGIEQLVIRTYERTNSKTGTEVSLEDPIAARKIITEHLQDAVLVGEKNFPANISYNKEYIEKIDYVDYTITGNKVTTKKVNYFNTIKPFVKIEYSKDSYAFFKGMNSYLYYAIPEDILPDSEESYELGFKTAETVAKDKAKTTVPKVSVAAGKVVFKTVTKKGYAQAALQAIKESDATLIFATDFNTQAEKLNKSASNYIGITLDRKSKAPKNLKPSAQAVKNIVENLNNNPHNVLHINGNDITSLYKAGYKQDTIDTYISNIVKAVVESTSLNQPINQIVTTGQTGISEAVIKVAKELGIATKVLVPSGYMFRVYSKAAPHYRDVRSESKFTERFKEVAEVVEKVKKSPVKKTVEEQKQVDKEINVTPLDNIFKNVSLESFFDTDDTTLNRTKPKTVWDIFNFVSKKSKDKADKWWAESPLSQHIPLERITAIVNSNAFATWSKSGITLYEADGGTSVDLYHEAWHGFSQLYLTLDEKTALYDEMRKTPKWSELEYIDIEELLAENFRSYAKGKAKFSGPIGSIFKKIMDFLKTLFNKSAKLVGFDMTRPQDIATVKELYDNLYFGNKHPQAIINLKPSIQNVFPEFGVLNRLKTIQVLNSESKNFEEFTITQSDKLSKMMDGIMGKIFDAYNSKNDTSSGANTLLANPANRVVLYNNVKIVLDNIYQNEVAKLETLTIQNSTSENPNYFLEQHLQENVELLLKALVNFGDITSTLDGKSQKGLVAYHMNKSIFNVLKRSYIEEVEDVDDPTNTDQTKVFQDASGNVVSSKSIASEDTMMLIASVFKIETDEEGNTVYDSEGSPVRVTDEFGIPVLADPSITWNRLAKILAGTFDDIEMYDRLGKYVDSHPELLQVINMLPKPKPGMKYKNNSEFTLETNFLQDLKKPRLKYIQLNVNKKIITKAFKGNSERPKQKEVATYESRMIKADFDTFSTIRNWDFNFINDTEESNKFIDQDTNLNNILNTQKIINTFGVNGLLNPRKGNDLLKAIGIYLDTTSPQIKSIVEDPRFIDTYNIRLIFDIIKKVNAAANSNDLSQIGAAEKFQRNPLKYLMEGLPVELRTEKDKGEDVKARIRGLANLQLEYSDTESNFSVLSPEKNRVWEHFLDSTATRYITSMNHATSWQELTDSLSDPNDKFIHMRWLAEANNPQSKYSILLNSIFVLDVEESDPTYGTKRENSALKIDIVSGTQLITEGSYATEGVSTSSADATTKNIQEIHSMLMNGIQEFMRHASKQTSMGLTATEVETYPGKENKNLYIDINRFKSPIGENHGFNIVSGYMAGELERIYRFKNNVEDSNIEGAKNFKNWAGYNRLITKKDGTIVMAGEVFTAFDDVLTEPIKDKLYALVDKARKNKVKFNLNDELEANQELRALVKSDVASYFNKQTQQNVKRLQQARYIDLNLYNTVATDNLTPNQVDEILMKAYTYNSWIHNMETVILMYGDLVQYDHEKEEFHKRNAGLGAPGRTFRADKRAQEFINSSLFKKYYAEAQGYTVRKYDGTLKTAILKEKVIKESIYREEIEKALIDSYVKRYKDSDSIKPKDRLAKAKSMAKIAIEEYFNMKEADGQGHITFESYRMLKKLESNWSDAQEVLYRKIAMGQKVDVTDVVEFFPPYKLQYYGNIQTEGLPITSFHKFSLAPLIPSVIGNNSVLSKLHNKLMEQQIDYAVFESGSKIAHITSDGKGDTIYNEDGTFNESIVFTPNTIFAEFLKNQTEVNKTFKNKSIFSTQLRKLVLEGLYEKGIIDTTEEDKITTPVVIRYLKNVSEYTELVKLELLEEIGYEEINGEYIPTDKKSIEKVAKLIRENLEADDVLGDHLIDLIDITEDGSLKFDLSLHPESSKIEKLLLSIINKRIIKQKVKGEPLVQVSAAMYEGIFESQAPKLRKGNINDVKKWIGSTFLPTYYQKENGNTAAMKVMIALQGDYINLLKLKDLEGNEIGTIEKLNELIKDDNWLDLENNRKAITMVGVRIPVQGLNSMEFMEVFHFLPAEAGNIIVPPSEIVAKSGADFDIDKLTLFMPNINSEGIYQKRKFENQKELIAEVNKLKAEGESISKLIKSQKTGLENELIEDIRNILELPQNFASLVTPNGTFLLKDIAGELAKYVMDYEPLTNMSSKTPNKSVKDKSIISPTRVLESQYNLYKHESNVIGKKTLGLGAVQNTFNAIFNSLGAVMPATYTQGSELNERVTRLLLKHNIVSPKGVDVISLSNRYDADNINKVADIVSQMMNGWVDVEKDAWIFFIQGNYEVAPILLYLIKAGVPVKEAIYFVSQPLVRDYVNEQRLAESTYADPLRKKPENDSPVKYTAASRVLYKYFGSKDSARLNKNRARYDEAVNSSEKLFEDRDNKQFTFTEMDNLIQDYKLDKSAGSSPLSKAMFLHYLELEKQIEGVTQLQMASNPDTSTKTNINQVEQAEANINNLDNNSKIDKDLIYKIKNDSIISSFFNGPLALAISRPLFSLRYHETISRFVIAFKQAGILKSDAKVHFNGNEDALIDTFRNDIVTHIFQNALRQFEIGDSYKSYSVETTIPTKLVDQLKFGAYVKQDAKGRSILYIDKNQLKREFDNKEWSTNSELSTTYGPGKLQSLDLATFMNNKSTNEEEYYKFVAEREYLRTIYTIEEVSKLNKFNTEKKVTLSLYPDLANEKVTRVTYERMLANRALENTFNPYHMFKDKTNSIAIKLSNILKNNPNLRRDYSVLEKMNVEANDKRTLFNIILSDKEFDNSKSNLYHSNLLDLANPQIKKAKTEEENNDISDFFARLSLFSFLQSGLNKTKYNFNNVVDYTALLDVLTQASLDFRKILSSDKGYDYIVAFYQDNFLKQNSRDNKDRIRYKELAGEVTSKALTQLAQPINEDEVAIDIMLNVTPTSKENVFIFNDTAAKVDTYKSTLNLNPTTVFVYNQSLASYQNPESKTSGQTQMKKVSPSTTIGLITGLNSLQDSLQDIGPENYKLFKDAFELRINDLRKLLDQDIKIAFSSNGYGDSSLMPEELFVYLSRRLFEEFGYVNPGSDKYKQIEKLIVKKQGITDQEILKEFEDQESPFKCNI